MNGTKLQLTLRELTWVLTRPRLWLVFGLVLAIFALTGPFGTYEVLNLPARIGYWFIVQAITWIIALTTIAICGGISGKPAYENLHIVLIGAALAAFPIALAVELVGMAVFDRPLTLAGYGWQLTLTVPISLLICILVYFFLAHTNENEPLREITAKANPVRLLSRLPIEKRGAVQYLTMQDHYVEVVTDKGNELLLLRLADAIVELAGVDGMQIHRSHWVALEAVAASRREGGKLLLTMKDGVELPVSRPYVKDVRAALDSSGLKTV